MQPPHPQTNPPPLSINHHQQYQMERTGASVACLKPQVEEAFMSEMRR